MSENSIPEELQMTSLYSLGEDAFGAILEDCRASDPKTIVEFGSGASSIRWAMEFPEATIYAIDHLEQYQQETLALKERYGITNLEAAFCPLKWQQLAGSWFFTYSGDGIPKDVDVAVIDGPPMKFKQAREACMYKLFEHVRVGGRIYLDDFQRPSEMLAAAQWLERYPKDTFETHVLNEGHRVYAMVKLQDAEVRTGPQMIADDVRERSRESVIKPIKKIIKNAL